MTADHRKTDAHGRRAISRPPWMRGLAALAAPAGLFGAAMVVFHAWLFGRRLLDGGLFETSVALRWLGTFALVGAWVVLRRRGITFRGRRAVVLWLLILLLHAGAAPITEVGDALQSLPLAGVGLLALPAVLGSWLFDALVALLPALDTPHGAAPRYLTPAPQAVAAAGVGDFPPAFRRPPPA